MEVDEKKVEEQRKKFKAELDHIVSECLPTIRTVPNLLQLCKDMDDRKDYPLVIKVGRKAEERISELVKELELREELKRQQTELEQQIMLQKNGATPEQQKQQQQINEKLEKLPLLYPERSTLDSWTIKAAERVIKAAKIEDNDEVLREQTILAFKTQTTPERWNQVRMLTSEAEWADVKKELVVYLLKGSTDEQSSDYINPAVKVELLLMEG